jgi:hypothetical protein
MSSECKCGGDTCNCKGHLFQIHCLKEDRSECCKLKECGNTIKGMKVACKGKIFEICPDKNIKETNETTDKCKCVCLCGGKGCTCSYECDCKDGVIMIVEGNGKKYEITKDSAKVV